MLISVAFLTLLERKILGYIQLRKGPNKVGFLGLLQPFSDGLKLFSKEIIYIIKTNYYFYILCPILRIILIFILWFSLPYWVNFINRRIHILLILCIIRLGVYTLIISGWSSGSRWRLVGRLRGIAQTISYEVSLIFIIFSVIILVEEFNLICYYKIQYYSWFIIILFPVRVILFISLIAEINRTPFDFSEGESELVSGFNVEYISGPFALFFIAEYGIILFISYFFSILFLGGNIYSLLFYFMFIIIVILVIWFRGTFPRIRYDIIIDLVWKEFLPSILGILIILAFFKMIIINFII